MKTHHLAIRRTSDDKWYNFTSGEWDTVGGYGDLTSDHKKTLTDNNDGSYSCTWDQGVADGGMERTYIMVFEIASGTYQGMAWEKYVCSYEFADPADRDLSAYEATAKNGTKLGEMLAAARASVAGKMVISGTTMTIWDVGEDNVILTYTLNDDTTPTERSSPA